MQGHNAGQVLPQSLETKLPGGIGGYDECFDGCFCVVDALDELGDVECVGRGVGAVPDGSRCSSG